MHPKGSPRLNPAHGDGFACQLYLTSWRPGRASLALSWRAFPNRRTGFCVSKRYQCAGLASLTRIPAAPAIYRQTRVRRSGYPRSCGRRLVNQSRSCAFGRKRIMDVIVIGGGIGGIATAYQLRAAGHRVCVVERHATVAQGATYGHGGAVLPSPLDVWFGPTFMQTRRAMKTGIVFKPGFDSQTRDFAKKLAEFH